MVVVVVVVMMLADAVNAIKLAVYIAASDVRLPTMQATRVSLLAASYLELMLWSVAVTSFHPKSTLIYRPRGASAVTKVRSICVHLLCLVITRVFLASCIVSYASYLFIVILMWI